MKKLLVVAMLLLSVAVVSAQVNVTFRVNTAAIPDTLGPNSVVQLRGDTAPLTWDGASACVLTHVGGDYWEGTFAFPANSNITYKIYTNAEHSTVAAGDAWEHEGWEANTDDASTNRLLATADADTTLPLQFANGVAHGKAQYFTPYETNDSTFVLYVRVNMQGWEDFNANNHVVGIRGSNTDDWGQTGELSWGPTYPLTQEADHANGPRYSGGYFYSGAVHVPNKYADKGVKFKVVVHNAGADLGEDWGNMVYNSGREDEINFSGTGADTTIHWFWFDNLVPIPTDHQDEVIVNFQADMANAIQNRGFAFGDTLYVRNGYFGTADAVSEKMMLRQGVSTIYAATDTITTTLGANLDYQYYSIKNGTEYREIYYNFYYDGQTAGEAERRMAMNIADGMTIADVEDSQTELHRMPLFRNVETLADDVLVTYHCDLRPAYYTVLAGIPLNDIQGNLNVTDPANVMAWGLAMNGPATGNWDGWGAGLMVEGHMMYDDGTHGDVAAGDSIFAIQFTYGPDSTNHVVGQEFKFGIGGGDNEGGEGGFGNNHIENIDDTQSTFAVHVQFGSINPAYYSAWDFDTQTGVEDDAAAPVDFALQQNYPNPFNPTTTIDYAVAKGELVKIEVYNMLGQKVATLVDEKVPAGKFNVTWDASEMATGMYFYRIEAGDYKKTMKMLLLK